MINQFSNHLLELEQNHPLVHQLQLYPLQEHSLQLEHLEDQQLIHFGRLQPGRLLHLLDTSLIHLIISVIHLFNHLTSLSNQMISPGPRRLHLRQVCCWSRRSSDLRSYCFSQILTCNASFLLYQFVLALVFLFGHLIFCGLMNYQRCRDHLKRQQLSLLLHLHSIFLTSTLSFLMMDLRSSYQIYGGSAVPMGLGCGLVLGAEVPSAHCGLFPDSPLLLLGFREDLLLHFVVIGFDSK